MKRRWLRILVTILVIVCFTLYFAFTTFFFSPLEEDFPHDLATLVPRDVDFYVSKAGLNEDLGPDLRPPLLTWLRDSREGLALSRHPRVARLMTEFDPEALLTGLRAELSLLPFQIQPLDVFGGRDLAVAGTFRGPDLAAADWAVYGRSNWMGKLGVELLAYPDLIGLPEQGFQVTPFEGGVTISGGRLPRPLFVARILDVAVLATTEELVRQAHTLEGLRGQDSLGLSAKYGDHIGPWHGDGDELEVYVDYDALSSARGWQSVGPDPSSPDFTSAFLGRFFQLDSMRDLVSTFDFQNGITMRLHGMLSSEGLSAFQKRLYRTRGFERDRVVGPQQVGSLVPADAGLFLLVNANLGDLIRQALQSSEAALRSNFDDLVREVWGYPDGGPLIDEIDAAFKSRLAFALRDDDFPEDPDGPPHNDRVVPAWALVFWVQDVEKLGALVKRVQARPDVFGISGGDQGPRGIWENIVQGGHTVIEYWSQLIDGTGHLATLQLGEYFVVSNHHKLLGEMVKTYYDGGTRFPRLSEDPWFSSQVNAGLVSSNLLLWANPRAVSATTRGLARQGLGASVVIDWRRERPRIEAEVLRDDFSGRDADDLTEPELQRYDALVQTALDDYERSVRNSRLPEIQDSLTRDFDALEVMRGLLVELAIDQKDFEVYARLAVPMQEGEATPAGAGGGAEAP